jgi:hypothetical protein
MLVDAYFLSKNDDVDDLMLTFGQIWFSLIDKLWKDGTESQFKD